MSTFLSIPTIPFVVIILSSLPFLSVSFSTLSHLLSLFLFLYLFPICIKQMQFGLGFFLNAFGKQMGYTF